MHIAVTDAPNGAAVIALAGRLDLLTAADTKRRIAEAVAAGHPRVVIDLADVTFMDSSGLSALVSGLKAARQAGGDLRIARPTAQVTSILKLTMLDRVLQPFGSVEEALAGY